MTATRPSSRPIAMPEPMPDSFGAAPRPRPSRNLPSLLLGVLVVVFCAAGVAAYTTSLGHRRAVLAVVRPVNAGSAIQDSDLGEAHLPVDPALRTISASQRSAIVGRIAGVNLVPGTLLAEAELATGPQVDASHAVVGLALKDGQFPAGLRPLDPVSVVETSPASSSSVAPGDATVLVGNAQVVSSATAADGQSTIVSVLVPLAAASTVANAAAQGQVSLILLGADG